MEEEFVQKMKARKTERGFTIIEFDDDYGEPCSIQESSLMGEPCLWLGSNVDRMHLNQELVEKLISILEGFMETGRLDENAV